MAPPPKKDLILRIIIPEIIFRNSYFKASVDIPEILACQSTFIIFLMSQNKNTSAVFCRYYMRTHFPRISQYPQFRTCLNIASENLGMPGMRSIEHFIKPSHQRVMRSDHLVFKYTEYFFIKKMLVNTVMIVQSRLRSPAYEHCAVHMGFGKIEYFTQFLPVIHFLIRHLFNRSTG